MEEIRIKTAICIIYILEDFKIFIENLTLFLKKVDYTSYSINDLEKISQKKKVFGRKEEKKFYKENQLIIDTINQYFNISNFIFEVCFEGKKHETAIGEYYKYIEKNHTNKNKILLLLNHLNNLGFKKIVLDLTNDFSKAEYQVFKDKEDNINPIFYLQNLERIPNYNGNVLKYKSKGSNYKIQFKYFYLTNQFYFNSTIEVNSLLFNTNVLPNSIDFEEIFHQIISLDKEEINENDFLRQSTDLSLKINKLSREITELKSFIEKLKDFKGIQELKESLVKMELELLKIKQMSLNNNNILISESTSITEEVLSREKLLVEQRFCK